MEKKSPAQEANSLDPLEAEAPDTKIEFEMWLDKLRPREPIRGARPHSPSLDQHKPDFMVSCTEGDCQISFEGVVQLEGFVSANIRSEAGTLVTGGGLIDGNIDVGAAYLDGSVIGNIRASERVVLYSEAKVAGNIITPALSTKPGALFEGDCILHESIERRIVPLNKEVPTEFVDQI